MGLTIKELIPLGADILKNEGVDNAEYDAEALIGAEIGFDKKKIFMNWTYEVEDDAVDGYLDKIRLRASGKPLQYILGEAYFMGHRFKITESVLIPRPETESLTEKAIVMLAGIKKAGTVLDLGTGSGVIAISLALKFPGLKITASDISKNALAVAKENASAHQVNSRIEFVQSDLFENIKHSGFGGKKFDLIVSNPPYIKTLDIPKLAREVRDFEPQIALDGGWDGLDFYLRIASQSKSYFKKGGGVLLEIGADQGESAKGIFADEGFGQIQVSKDLSGFDRILSAVWEDGKK